MFYQMSENQCQDYTSDCHTKMPNIICQKKALESFITKDNVGTFKTRWFAFSLSFRIVADRRWWMETKLNSMVLAAGILHWLALSQSINPHDWSSPIGLTQLRLQKLAKKCYNAEKMLQKNLPKRTYWISPALKLDASLHCRSVKCGNQASKCRNTKHLKCNFKLLHITR